MSLRFRKSIKIAPGIKMNLGGSGISWTLGPRGASIGIGARGTYLNTGIPGTGLYSRQHIDAPRKSGNLAPRVDVPMTVSVTDDGMITFKDSNGNLASEALITAAKKQKGDFIRQVIQKTCDDINNQAHLLAQLHLHTPIPNQKFDYQPKQFLTPKPKIPLLKKPNIFYRLFKNKVSAIEVENTNSLREYERKLRQWELNKNVFEAAEKSKQNLILKAQAGDIASMESFFEEALQDIIWPRETIISFEIGNLGQFITLDVDLPEIEEMPTKVASVPQRGFKLNIKEMGASHIQKLYAKHIHAIIFRLIGEAFGLLPTIDKVTISGYSQRHSKLTGHLENQYLLSVVVMRKDWEEINFGGLDTIDPIEALYRFELRRDMTKTGNFKSIEPFGAANQGELNQEIK